MSQVSVSKLLKPVYNNVTLIKGDITYTLHKNLDIVKGANVFFIDGPHTYEAVSRDYAIIEKISSGKTMVVIDDPHIPGIGRFVRELAHRGKQVHDIVGSSVVFV
jgi:hypothetical protein